MEYVPVKGQIKPDGDFPAIIDAYIRLAFRSVGTTQARNNIRREFRTFPMWVIVDSLGQNAILYSLKAEPGTEFTTDNDWKSVPLGIDFDTLTPVGKYDASSNTPDLVADQASYNLGDYFIANVAGIQDVGDGDEQIEVLDWIILTVTGWKVINIAGSFNFNALEVIPPTGNDTDVPSVKAVRDYVIANSGAVFAQLGDVDFSNPISMQFSGYFNGYTTVGNLFLDFVNGAEGVQRWIDITFNGSHTLSFADGVFNLTGVANGAAPNAGTYQMIMRYVRNTYRVEMKLINIIISGGASGSFDATFDITFG